MGEGRLLLELIVAIAKLIFWLLRGIFRILLRIGRASARRVRGAPVADPTAPAPSTIAKAAPSQADAAERAAAQKLATQLSELASRARALEARASAEPLCAPLLPSLRSFLLPELDRVQADLRLATGARLRRPIAAAAAFLRALTDLLTLMTDQRCDPDLDELTDDADALAEACYGPVVDYCRTNGVPLSSDRAAAVFGDDCSPWLGRIDDPTGLAFLHLPWTWLTEVHRWPAIGHEVGHDFYESVTGLDTEVLRRHGLEGLVPDTAALDGSAGVSMRDVERIVTTWRRELVADAFGVMMLGPAYVVTTATIFAKPGAPHEALAVQLDEDGDYEVHPPGHIRVAAACRLLARMGYGALGVTMEQKWRAQHGEPTSILLPVPNGWIRVDDQPFIERAVQVTTSLYQEGFAALRGIPLASMPGFDFGPREHEAALRARDAFLAGGPPVVTDARLIIAGAVLAWAERPHDNLRILRAARLAVGKLPLRVPQQDGDGSGAPRGVSSAAELIRDAFLLDLLLSPPVSLSRRGPQAARR